MFLKCDVDTVTTKSVKAPTRSPVWGLASCHDIEQYQLKLDKILQDSYPTLDMFLDHSESKLCLKKNMSLSSMTSLLMQPVMQCINTFHIQVTENQK